MPATPDRSISTEMIIPAALQEVWQAWTTEPGVQTFFAPAGRIDLVPGGQYEMYFDLEASPGQRGGEGCVVLAVQPGRMLSFTWNPPPEHPETRDQHTHVVVRFHPVEDGKTRVTLVHDGWGEGQAWDATMAYFKQAWGRVVLPRLHYRFTHGPIDWKNPPRFGKNGFCRVFIRRQGERMSKQNTVW